ncbi:MAG: hypothetical protein EHM33_02065 [Chloroflexi bacterium]|nr:MAG: hypothetical protein EHM33_02065 [Chloroflexota bacterium]
MPRPTYDFLLNQLSECRRELGALSTDEDWNVTTFKAIPFQLKRVAESARFVVVVSIRNWGATLPGSVRRALNFRAPQVLLRARWDNHSEAVFVLSDDPDVFCERLLQIAKNEGLQVSLSHTPYSGNIRHDHDRAAANLTPQVYTTETE